MIDISLFCVKLEKLRWDRVNMLLFCAPGYGRQLARDLHNFKAREKSPACVIICRPIHVLGMAKELRMPEEVLLGLERYVAAWKTSRRGVVVQMEVQEARRKAVEGVPGLCKPSEEDDVQD